MVVVVVPNLNPSDGAAEVTAGVAAGAEVFGGVVNLNPASGAAEAVGATDAAFPNLNPSPDPAAVVVGVPNLKPPFIPAGVVAGTPNFTWNEGVAEADAAGAGTAAAAPARGVSQAGQIVTLASFPM